MATVPIDALLSWLRAHCQMGEQLLVDVLDRSPRWFFEQGTSNYAMDFFNRIDQWTAWCFALIGGLRRRLIDSDHLVSAAEERFRSGRMLRFHIRPVDDPRLVYQVDLGDRDWYLDSAGWTQLRQQLHAGREAPSWNVVRQNIKLDLGRFVKMVEAQRDELVIAGEPRSPKLQDVLSRLAELPYIDDRLVKTDVLAAESHFQAGHAKDVGAAFRRAIEQVLRDGYAEARTRSGNAPPTTPPNMNDQTREVGLVLASRATAHAAYGAYALLSELGSHSGSCDPDELDAIWHTGVSALCLLAKRLRA